MYVDIIWWDIKRVEKITENNALCWLFHKEKITELGLNTLHNKEGNIVASSLSSRNVIVVKMFSDVKLDILRYYPIVFYSKDIFFYLIFLKILCKCIILYLHTYIMMFNINKYIINVFTIYNITSMYLWYIIFFFIIDIN